MVEVLRKDTDGWWLVRNEKKEKGLVPGSYLQVEEPVIIDPAILAAREVSNRRFSLWRRMEPKPEKTSPTSCDAKSSSDVQDKPIIVRKLKKCHACMETILGRTKTHSQGEIFHEIVSRYKDQNRDTKLE